MLQAEYSAPYNSAQSLPGSRNNVLLKHKKKEIQDKKEENLCTNVDKGVTDDVITFLAINVTFQTLILILTLSYTLKWYAL